MARESFVFYKSFADALRCLPDDQRLQVYDAICSYALEGDAGEVDGIVAAVLCLVKPQIDANNKRYENGKKGGRPMERTEDEVIDDSKFRRSTEYKKWRDAVIAKNGKVCAKCGTTEGQLNAHHIKNIHDYPNLRLEVSNGVVLCNTCHAQAHQEQTMSKPRANQEATNTEPNVNVNVNENVNVNVNELKDVSSERFASSPADCEAIPLNDGTEWRPTTEELEEYARLYPGVDVRRALASMRGWCLSNPTQKKTRRGVKAFVNRWLDKEQNRATRGAPPGKPNGFTDYHQRDNDYISIQKQLVKKALAN